MGLRFRSGSSFSGSSFSKLPFGILKIALHSLSNQVSKSSKFIARSDKHFIYVMRYNRQVGLRFRPVGIRFRLVGLRFRPQGLRSSVFVFGSSFSTHPTLWLHTSLTSLVSFSALLLLSKS